MHGSTGTDQEPPAGCRRRPGPPPLFLPPSRDSAGQARQHAAAAARSLGARPDQAASIVLVVSELVANAVRVTQETPGLMSSHVWVALHDAGDVIVAEVGDWAPGWPVLLDPAPDQENGRGLLLVAALSRRWGGYALSSGKVTWAEIAKRDQPGAPAGS